uniref:Uncharacterized protein n=1 Tax=Amphimedon queenslandica TaxID=400682 RepID=A0A1X7V6R4_AMPQE
MHFRNGDTTMEDWNHLMEQIPTKFQDQSPYVNALRLLLQLLLTTMLLCYMSVVIPLPPPMQYILEPMQPKFHLMILVA